MMWSYDMGWGGWWMMSLAMVAFWALVVYVVVALVRGDRQSEGPADRRSNPDPGQILDERFARGEIGSDEYRARQQVLLSPR